MTQQKTTFNNQQNKTHTHTRDTIYNNIIILIYICSYEKIQTIPHQQQEQQQQQQQQQQQTGDKTKDACSIADPVPKKHRGEEK